MNANIWDQSEPIEALIRSRQPVDPNGLIDPDVDLTSLVPNSG
jgi:3-phenylpropionate/trans-cinnamate dioxygenase ferredoxin reductase component